MAVTFFKIASIILCACFALQQPARAEASLSPEESAAYDKVMHKEREARSRERFVENAVGGLAAMTIGIYGYYNDNRGTLVKLAYGAAQTSGVIMLCKSIFEYNEPSLLLNLDERLKQHPELSEADIKREILHAQSLREHSQAMTIATSSSILGTLYLYNASRTEADESELRSIFYFLSFNFYIAAAGGWYKVLHKDTAHAARPAYGLSVDLLPTPQITYNF